MFRLLLAFCFLPVFSPLSAQTFSSTVNQLIPDDNTTVTFDIPVSGLPDVIDTLFGLEQVCINLTHTYDEDMQVLLRAPDGKTVLLFGGVGGGEDNFTNTCVAGDGTPFSSGTAPYTGTFRSYGILGNINNGQNPNGTWTLILYDTYAAADQGFLIDWSIRFSNNPAKPYIFTSSNLPIVKLTTLGQPIVDDPKVPVQMQIIDNGPGLRNDANQVNYAFEGRIMAELQGYTGVYESKKNYSFETVDPFGTQIDTSILGMPTESDWIFKSEYLDHTLIKNTVAYEMARRMGDYAPRTRPCEIILDGEYVGVYVLTEKVKRSKNRVDIAKLTPSDLSGSALTGGYIIEMNINDDPNDWASEYPAINQATAPFNVEFKHVYPKSNTILPEQHDYIRGYVDDFENALADNNFTDPATGYRSYIDVGTFLDFLIVNEFSVNYDSYGRSTYMYKEKDTDGGKLKIGPPWDYDRAMDYYVPDATSGWVWEIAHPYWPYPFWWSRMWEDGDYRHQLACRWTMLRQNTLRTDAFMGLIDSTAATLQEAQQRNFRIWNDLGNSTYDVQIDSLKSFITRRLNWIDATLAEEQVALPAVYLPTDTVFCAGSVFDAAALNGNQYEYNWQPGPDTSTITLLLDGNYHLQVTDKFGCYVQKDMHVTVGLPVDAGFTAQQVNNGLAWEFQPNNPPAQSYLWDFGDGTTSSLMNPVHSYATGGLYVVTLTVTGSYGCFIQTAQYTIQFTYVNADEQTALKGAIFPNPFQENIQIRLSTPATAPFTLYLDNEAGQTVLTQDYPAGTQTCSLVTARVPAGAYALRMSMGREVWKVRVIRG